jgi:hypothetical protein
VKKVFPTIASVLALSSAAFTADAAYTVVAESFKPVTIKTSDSYTNVGSIVGIGGIKKSATYTNISGFNVAFAETSTITIVSPLPEVSKVVEGEDLKLEVEATAEGDLTYQWKKAGENIEGATESSYTISAAAADEDQVLYSVAISLGEDDTITQKTTVDVLMLPKIVGVSPSPSTTVAVGDALSLSVSATKGEEDQVLSYSWKKGGEAIDGATEATYSVASVEAANAGVYVATVSVTILDKVYTRDSDEVTVNVTNPNLPGPFTAENTTASLEYADWYESTIFGYFYWDSSWGSYISSLEHGTLYIDPNGTADSFWYYDYADESWFWTSETAYPALYSESREAWLIYSKSESVTGEYRYFWNDGNGTWVKISF